MCGRGKNERSRKKPPYEYDHTEVLIMLERAGCYRTRSCQKATALAAATLRESTWWDMGMRTV